MFSSYVLEISWISLKPHDNWLFSLKIKFLAGYVVIIRSVVIYAFALCVMAQKHCVFKKPLSLGSILSWLWKIIDRNRGRTSRCIDRIFQINLQLIKVYFHWLFGFFTSTFSRYFYFIYLLTDHWYNVQSI